MSQNIRRTDFDGDHSCPQMNSISDDDMIVNHHQHHHLHHSESYSSNVHHHNHHHHHHRNRNHHDGSKSVVMDGCDHRHHHNHHPKMLPHSEMYPVHPDYENLYTTLNTTCTHPSRNEHGGCDFSSVTEIEYSSSSTDIDLDHNHTDKKSNVSNNYYNHNIEENHNDNNTGTRYRDGCDYWTEKMNAYHNSSNSRSSDTISTSVATAVVSNTKTNNVAVVVDKTSTPTTTTTTSNTSNSHRPSIVGAISCCTPPPPTNHHKMIEVAPGEYMRLRGAKETWEAVQNDFYIPGTCICCEMTIFCIQDAIFVLCPICNVVTPLQQPSGMKILISNEYNGGVGLGFLMNELIQWQNDILASRK